MEVTGGSQADRQNGATTPNLMLLDAVSAKVTAAARMTAAAIIHFDFQISGAINFKTFPASGAVLGS